MAADADKKPSVDGEVPPGRRARKRAQNREQLLTSARTLFAERGIEQTTVQEITEAADLGFGTFYNHFADKDQLIDEVLTRAIADQGALINSITERIEDPAEVISVSHRYFIRRAAKDPEWAWLLLRLQTSRDVLLRSLAPFARRNLERGVSAGRLNLVDAELALATNGGALLAVMRTVLEGDAPADADVLHAEVILRIVGLSRDDAHEVANREFPQVDELASSGD